MITFRPIAWEIKHTDSTGFSGDKDDSPQIKKWEDENDIPYYEVRLKAGCEEIDGRFREFEDALEFIKAAYNKIVKGVKG